MHQFVICGVRDYDALLADVEQLAAKHGGVAFGKRCEKPIFDPTRGFYQVPAFGLDLIGCGLCKTLVGVHNVADMVVVTDGKARLTLCPSCYCGAIAQCHDRDIQLALSRKSKGQGGSECAASSDTKPDAS